MRRLFQIRQMAEDCLPEVCLFQHPAVAGIVMIPLILIALLILCCLWVRSKRRKQQQAPLNFSPDVTRPASALFGTFRLII